MSRALADLLGAEEVAFRQRLAQLERLAGAPGVDIRLGLHVATETRKKIAALGLDPADTHGPELYHALQAKLLRDEAVAAEALKVTGKTSAEKLVATTGFISKELHGNAVFAMKAPVLKRILKSLKPKATMKALGYRSMESMFKHEAVAGLVVATLVSETPEWHKQRLRLYAQLQASDFEVRNMQYVLPSGKKWPSITTVYTQRFRSHIATLPELGAIVTLPSEKELPALIITSLVLLLEATNDINTASSFLKSQQVQPNFGQHVHNVVLSEPMSEGVLAGETIPWKVLHWLYGTGHAEQLSTAFEPYFQHDDIVWHHSGKTLARLHESLVFWQDTAFLGLLENRATVSLNVLDVALGVCNGMAYGKRVLHTMQSALSRELLARYLRQDNLQDTLESALHRQAFAPEFELDTA